MITAESIRECVRKMREQNAKPDADGYYKVFVHPLRDLLIKRRCDPQYCHYLGFRLANNWRQLYDQTFADYNGWGINNDNT